MFELPGWTDGGYRNEGAHSWCERKSLVIRVDQNVLRWFKHIERVSREHY